MTIRQTHVARDCDISVIPTICPRIDDSRREVRHVVKRDVLRNCFEFIVRWLVMSFQEMAFASGMREMAHYLSKHRNSFIAIRKNLPTSQQTGKTALSGSRICF